MRTTLDIDDALLRKAKARARQTHRTLTGIIEEALRQTLMDRPPGAMPVHEFSLKTVRGALLPGVDVSDRDSLYERMEGRS
jgi:predicted transcriptional regulator